MRSVSIYAWMDPCELLAHRGHTLTLFTFGAGDENVILECEDCAYQLFNVDLEEEAEAHSLEVQQ